VVPTWANGQPAFAHYDWDAEEQRFVAHDIVVVTLDGDRIAEMTAFMGPGAVGGFGLPSTVA
jgi:RNA polymerase sigma-70 factor (ECF subfamily)